MLMKADGVVTYLFSPLSLILSSMYQNNDKFKIKSLVTVLYLPTAALDVYLTGIIPIE